MCGLLDVSSQSYLAENLYLLGKTFLRHFEWCVFCDFPLIQLVCTSLSLHSPRFLPQQFDVLGTRTPEELRYVRSEDARHFIDSLPRKRQVSWSSLFPGASDKALLLLDSMLQFDASKRITVDEALDHPYFDSVRLQYLDEDPAIRMGKGGFDFSFEYDAALEAEGETEFGIRILKVQYSNSHRTLTRNRRSCTQTFES